MSAVVLKITAGQQFEQFELIIEARQTISAKRRIILPISCESNSQRRYNIFRIYDVMDIRILTVKQIQIDRSAPMAVPLEVVIDSV